MTPDVSALSVVTPAIMLIFALAFASAWRLDRRRGYILGLAASCLLFALGALSQSLHAPPDYGLNTLLSGAFYTGAVLMASQAVTRRAGRRTRWTWLIIAFVGVEIALWWFYYVDRSLVTRIYIQNFSYGVILLITAIRIRRARATKAIEACLFYVLLAFALHFFPRTLYFIALGAPTGAADFWVSPFWRALMITLPIFGAALAVTILLAIFSDVIDDLRKDRDSDGLTGLLNRRGFKERAVAMLESAREPPSLIVCDIDRFKPINDRFGHAAGDIALTDVAQILLRHAPPGAIVGRLGGEEFAILLAGGGIAGAVDIAERMRMAIAGHGFEAIPALGRVTASFGVATGQAGECWETLLRRADELLYAAKRRGRDQTAAETAPAAPKIYAVS